MGTVRSTAQQKPDTVGAAGLAGQVEGGVAPRGLRVHCGPGIKQSLDTATSRERGGCQETHTNKVYTHSKT